MQRLAAFWGRLAGGANVDGPETITGRLLESPAGQVTAGGPSAAASSDRSFERSDRSCTEDMETHSADDDDGEEDEEKDVEEGGVRADDEEEEEADSVETDEDDEEQEQAQARSERGPRRQRSEQNSSGDECDPGPVRACMVVCMRPHRGPRPAWRLFCRTSHASYLLAHGALARPCTGPVGAMHSCMQTR